LALENFAIPGCNCDSDAIIRAIWEAICSLEETISSTSDNTLQGLSSDLDDVRRAVYDSAY
jgi:hypothetical protein